MEVQLRDMAYSRAEGSTLSVCVDAGPRDRPFTITFTTLPDTAFAG